MSVVMIDVEHRSCGELMLTETLDVIRTRDKKTHTTKILELVSKDRYILSYRRAIWTYVLKVKE